jgi:hypothetical protein
LTVFDVNGDGAGHIDDLDRIVRVS